MGPMRGPFRLLRRDGIRAAALLAAGTLLAFGPDHHLLMMARAFLWPCTALFALLCLAALLKRWWWSAAAALLAAILVGTPPRAIVQAAPPPGAPVLLRVAQMNLLQHNDRHAAVVAAALGTGADVIAFQEVDTAWANALSAGLADAYPHRCLQPAVDLFGIALFSRLPLAPAVVRDLLGSPMIAATVRTPAGPVDVLAVHARSPDRHAHFRRRNEQFRALAAQAAGCSDPLVLVGDLNAVGWDDALVDLCIGTGLREHPGNLRPSWPAFAGLALAPIDHVLVRGGLALGRLDHFTIPGSDHLGLVADIVQRP